MAEALSAAKQPEGGPADPPAAAAVSLVEAMFQRRIEFHPARKPYSLLSGDGDFRLETLNPGPGPGRAAAAAAPLPGKRLGEGGFYEHGLDPELSFRITFRRIGAGLANLGNTCFLNSVLQCLTYTEPFAAYLQSGKHKSSCHTAGFCAMCALQNHVIAALQSSGKILSPSHLVKNLRCISRNFRNARQEDAHEYMVNLLESMHKCCLPSGVPSESPSAYERSLVHKIFGGRLRSQVKCTQCSYSSSKFDPFLDLSLEIVKADSLRKALAHFTAVEQLDGGQKQYQCQRCKEKVRALKQLTIHKAPYVLTIHLKRFGSHIPGQKIDKKVDFEPNLDLKPFVSDEHGGDLKYTLYGVLVHAGWSTHSGHYYCYVRTSSGIWHSLDDNQVRQVSEKTVLAQKAYMLFYVRDRIPVPKCSVNMVCKDNISANATGKKLIPESSLVSYGVIQNSLLEKKLSISGSISAKLKNCSTNMQNGLVIDPSMHKPLPQALSTLLNGGAALNGILEMENSTMQAHGESFSKGTQQTSKSAVLATDPVKPPLEKVLHEVKKDSTAEKVVCIDICGNVTPSIPKGGHSDAERFHISNNDDAVKTDAVVAHPSNFGCFATMYQRHVRRLLDERDMVKTTLQDEKLSSNQLPQEDNLPKQDEKLQNENLSSNQQPQEDNLPKQVNAILVHLSKQPVSSSPEKKASEDSKTHKLMKLKKKKKIATLNGLRFGRNYLFLASLSLNKFKKSKKRKKTHLSSKNLLESKSMSQNDQSPSTSESNKHIAVLNHSCSKHSRAVLPMENNTQATKSENNCNGGSSNATDNREEMNNSKNVNLPELPRTCLRAEEKLLTSRIAARDDRVQSQHNFLNLLMGGLKETTVPRWDDIDLPKSGLNGITSSTSTAIGYVLDEWDEEYDRGKRKKLRKSRQSFDGPNLFQETANLKAQQQSSSKLAPGRSQNQPFRI